MKRFTVFILLTALLCASISIVPGKTEVKAAGLTEITITEIIKNPTGSDLYEGVEVINLSSSVIDLSNYKLWYYSAATEAAVKSAGDAEMTRYMRIAEKAGEYTLKPQEIAFIWILNGDCFGKTGKINQAGATGYYATVNATTGVKTYRKDYVIARIEADGVGTIEQSKLVPLDPTDAQGTGAAAPRFNLANAVFNRLSITRNTATRGITDALCIADCDSTGSGTYFESGATTPTAKVGAYQYIPTAGSVVMKTQSFKAWSSESWKVASTAENAVYSPSGTVTRTMPSHNLISIGSMGEAQLAPFGIKDNDDLYVMSANLEAGISANRSIRAYTFMKHMLPDSIGVQEYTSNEEYTMFTEYMKSLGYTIVCPNFTNANGASTYTRTPIFYKTAKYTLVTSGAEKLTAYTGTNTKVLTWAVLKNNSTGKQYAHLNVHFAIGGYTGYSDEQAFIDRVKNAKSILSRVATLKTKYGAIPMVVTGDFNSSFASEGFKRLDAEFDSSILLAQDSIFWERSTNGDGDTSAITKTAAYPIDHVFVSHGHFSVKSSRVFNFTPLMRMVSDHYTVMAKLRLNTVYTPQCSHASGIYTSAQTVTLTNRTSGAVIYYTLDGTDPSTSATRKTYSAALSVSGESVLKYVAASDGVYSDVQTVYLSKKGELIITELCKNTADTDLYECVELTNISNHSVDLYDYTIWRQTADTAAALSSLNAADATDNIRLAFRRGEHIVQPGKTVIMWFVYGDVYTTAGKIDSAGNTARYVTLDASGNVTYHTDRVAARIALDGNGSIDPEQIIPLDITTRAVGYTDSGTKIVRFDHSTEEPSKVGSSFYFGNSAFYRMYLSFSEAPTASSAFCVADCNDITATAATSVGSYQFVTTSAKLMKTTGFNSRMTLGSLTLNQKLDMKLKGDINSDGSITVTDYMQMKLHFKRQTSLTSTQLAAADINENGIITSSDFLALKYYLASK